MCKKHLFVDLCQNVLTEIKVLQGNHTVSQSNNPKAVNGLSHTNVATIPFRRFSATTEPHCTLSASTPVRVLQFPRESTAILPREYWNMTWKHWQMLNIKKRQHEDTSHCRHSTI